MGVGRLIEKTFWHLDMLKKFSVSDMAKGWVYFMMIPCACQNGSQSLGLVESVGLANRWVRYCDVY